MERSGIQVPAARHRYLVRPQGRPRIPLALHPGYGETAANTCPISPAWEQVQTLRVPKPVAGPQDAQHPPDTPKQERGSEKQPRARAHGDLLFQDPLARIFTDEWQSLGERREIIIGHLRDRRLLLVVFCEPSEDRIRIISARHATPKEKRDYDQNTR